jgi:hypothetical protein
VPAVPAAGVPAREAVPFPLSAKLSPVGSAPDSLSFGIGNPDEATENDPFTPTVKAAAAPVVIAGACVTARVKFWVELGLCPLVALNSRV